MRIALLLGVLAIGGCKGASEQPAGNNATAAATNVAVTPTVSEEAVTNRAVLVEPKGPIDPKSAEAAGQVVQHYGALVEQRRFSDAERLWGDADAANRFTLALLPISDLHMEIGDLGRPEGAAGSIYVEMPVSFYGSLRSGDPVRKAATVTLRRVNDVPGSTEAQRRWHIERIEWKAA
jgi:hypothetical protein